MLSVGLDLHKRYSQVEALEENGDRRSGARLVNDFEQIEGFFRSLGEPCRVVLEAGWNWGSMYDWLERVENVVEVQLAHPYGVRAIAAAQVKTDRIDARMLGQLLRVGLIPRAYIPEKETRQLREAVRQRLFLVRVRTMLKNRIHALLDRHHVVPPPVSDIFGKGGRDYLGKVELPGCAQDLLHQDLRLLEVLGLEVRQTEKLLAQALKGDRRVELLLTVPGLAFCWPRWWLSRSTRSSVSPGRQSSSPTPVWFRRPTPRAKDLPRRPDEDEQQVAAMGAGGGRLDHCPPRPLLPPSVRSALPNERPQDRDHCRRSSPG